MENEKVHTAVVHSGRTTLDKLDDVGRQKDFVSGRPRSAVLCGSDGPHPHISACGQPADSRYA